MLHYRICGLNVAAEMPLPGANPLGHEPADTDVRVRLRPVPARLAAPTAEGPGWQQDARHFLLTLPDEGSFLAADGTALDVAPAPGSPVEDILPFVLGTGIGALLYQRGAMVLHAATVARGGGGIALCGHSGAGKSTLAATLCRLGCDLVSDDLAALTLGEAGGPPLVQPDGRCLKLFEPLIGRLGLEAGRGQPVRSGIGKHYVAPPAALPDPVPLEAVYVVQEAAGPYAAGITRQPPLMAAQVLLNQTYRRHLALNAARLDPRGNVIRSAVLRQVPVFRLNRPRDLERLEDVAAQVLDHWGALATRTPSAGARP